MHDYKTHTESSFVLYNYMLVSVFFNHKHSISALCVPPLRVGDPCRKGMHLVSNIWNMLTSKHINYLKIALTLLS